MKRMTFIFLSTFFCLEITQARVNGGDVGNGGGFAQCSDKKYYSYDYLMTLNGSHGEEDVSISFREFATVIGAQLKRLKDPLAADFETFIATMFTQNTGAKYQWFSRSQLPLMWEPDIESNLPLNCRKRVQAVYYFAPGGVSYASYTYDPKVIAMLQAQSNANLQLSFLWVHEWLWNHFSRGDFKKLALFNRLLHSHRFLSMSSSEYYSLRPGL